MVTRLKLKPGQKGTKRLVEKYGDALFCVRYRYDEASRTRIKTVEIVVEKKGWTPPPPKFASNELVPVRISYTENALKQLVHLILDAGLAYSIRCKRIILDACI